MDTEISVRGQQLQQVLNKVVEQISKKLTPELFHENLPDFDPRACMKLKEKLGQQVAKNVKEEVNALCQEYELEQKFKILDKAISIRGFEKAGTMAKLDLDESQTLKEKLINERLQFLNRKRQYLNSLKERIAKAKDENLALEREKRKLFEQANSLQVSLQEMPNLLAL